MNDKGILGTLKGDITCSRDWKIKTVDAATKSIRQGVYRDYVTNSINFSCAHLSTDWKSAYCEIQWETKECIMMSLVWKLIWDMTRGERT